MCTYVKPNASGKQLFYVTQHFSFQCRGDLLGSVHYLGPGEGGGGGVFTIGNYTAYILHNEPFSTYFCSR